MKPGRLQTLFAEDWLAKLWIGGIVAGVTIGFILQLLSTFAILGISLSSLVLGVAILLLSVIAYLASLVLGSCLLPPIYRMRERINGAPFQAGDLVEIMRKPYRGLKGEIIGAGEPRYGAFIRLENVPDGSKPLNIPWHAIRKYREAGAEAADADRQPPKGASAIDSSC